MSETPPPRRPLATFLRATPAAPSLIPTPAVPPTEPAEQVPPAPASALPPAPAAERVAAPPAQRVPAPSASAAAHTVPGDHGLAPPVAVTDATAAGRPDQNTQPLPGTVDAAQPGALRAAADRDASYPNAPGTPPASAHTTGRDTSIATAPASARPAGAAATPTIITTTDTDTSASHQVTSVTDSAPHADRLSGRTDPAATELATASAPAADPAEVEADVGGAPRDTTAQFHPLPAAAAPAFARRGIGRPRLRASGLQWAVLVGLVAVLGLQIVIADRAQLASNARWRPLVSAACTLARCTLPAWREPAALTLLNRDVRPLPGVAGVLQIQASFRNDARWAQAWPWLQLSLSDADGRVIGTRVLSPQEYLGPSPDAQDTLAPGQAVQVAFRVREPAASTAAFSFDFR
ncbi:DUF3426 domain-containing protein [Xanthomonas nasturtii]|uniref:DUF3426 domain-containing protein n=1 Tax=Xanthomonas nasturtii TaxID=1843581 RepID=UPI002011F81C|nr:DUF3426 domain-containing protein [Xanthomonas nasturtii]MCL1570085.1 DUF3426 domain-containing protein [Xanthomonas nasturtii]MCL1574019.1 DUF3426 domain-containing protein [Xanthomonas nasturtii]MCL1581679.1 DUF3426 domain-containing protein [Xanthomonas nasturtii]MCL1585563.1 DUF3426 domain-containing protein [Xanthomonas nasturtii]MCL1591458.1 DUF3426 domain-containing protein [Xanthomonas nasturtii]